jgi:hypothetical protein
MTALPRVTVYPGQGQVNPANVTVTNTVSTTSSGTGSFSGTVSVSNTVSVTVSNFPATQTVSGTVTASVPNPVTVSGTVSVSNIAQSASFVTAQVTVTASATQLFASGASVNFREVLNPSTVSIFIGNTSSLTTTTGHYLLGSSAFDQQFNSSAMWGVTTTGSVTVSTAGW